MPNLTFPSSGLSLFSKILSNVVLPAPFPPTIPIRSPRSIVVEKLSMIVLFPNEWLTFVSSATILPEFSWALALNFAFPCNSIRPFRVSRIA